MKIQNVNILPFSAQNSVKTVLKFGDAIKTNNYQATKPQMTDAQFNKQKSSVMRKALILSLVMLSGTIAYFKKTI